MGDQHYLPSGYGPYPYPGADRREPNYYSSQPVYSPISPNRHHEIEYARQVADLMERVHALEERQHETLNNMHALELCHAGIRQDIDILKSQDRMAADKPSEKQPEGSNSVNQQSRLNAGVDMDRKVDEPQKAQAPGVESKNNGQTNGANGSNTVQQVRTTSIPPHLRNAAKATVTPPSTPPHLRGTATTFNPSTPPHRRVAAAKGQLSATIKDANNTFMTNGPVDRNPLPSTSTQHLTPMAPTMPPTPSSPSTTIIADTARPSIEDPFHLHSAKGWMPHYITTLPAFTPPTPIPPITTMVTFSPDFLSNQLGGNTWSPGLQYIPPTSATPSILPGRAYYTLNADVEPYLPKAPGEHGAKQVPFFNVNPEDVYEDAMGDSSKNVPLFICATPWATDANKRRYVYFGDYSQTRWSDKLDYDRMRECVPAHVKQYWAQELAAKGRPDWVTEALMNHFWPKPTFEGDILAGGDEGGEAEEKMRRAVGAFVEELRNWDKEARLKVSLLRKEDILRAFETADADDPPALRLWWEYLQCTGWNGEFYEMLVELQKRNKNYL